MTKLLKDIALIPFVLAFCSCSMIQKQAIKVAADPLWQMSQSLEQEHSWAYVASALPTEIQLIEGLLNQVPTHSQYLALATKSQTAYAFLVLETKILVREWQKEWGEEWGETKSLKHKNNFYPSESDRQQAIYHYGKAVYYGLELLRLEGLDHNSLIEGLKDEQKLVDRLNKAVDKTEETVQGIFFTGLALAAQINLQKNNMKLLAQLPLANVLVEWACAQKPDLYRGACPMFRGIYQVSRPAMLGGNPKLGIKYFKEAMNSYPDNWFIAWAYVQYALIPSGDARAYEEVKEWVKKWRENWEGMYTSMPGEKKKSSSDQLPLFQSTALERFHQILPFEKQLFSTE